MTSKTEEIRNFLIYSAQNGYGNEQAKTIDEADGSHTIEVTSGNLKLHDNYFGGEPYGGREIIFKGEKPIWMMTYYGAVKNLDELSLKEVYGFLRENLLKPDSAIPIRGPIKNKSGKWNYRLDLDGDLADFKCKETITHGGKIVYEASFRGGLVDQQDD